MSTLVRSVLLGSVTGGRSTFGLAALAITAPESGSVLTSGWTRRAACLAAAGEVVGDKLPSAPARTAPSGLLPRLVAGAASAAILARREGESDGRTALAGALGALAAGAAAFAGVRLRARAAAELGTDLPGAVLEDLAWGSAARYATRAG